MPNAPNENKKTEMPPSCFVFSDLDSTPLECLQRGLQCNLQHPGFGSGRSWYNTAMKNYNAQQEIITFAEECY